MKRSINIKSFVVVAFVIFGAAACRGNTSDVDKESLKSMNNAAMGHFSLQESPGHDQVAGDPALPKSAPLNGFNGMPAPGTKAVCPVMGNEFEVTPNTTFSVYKGKTYVFCCPGCKPAFEADPAKYLKKQ